MAYIIDWVFIWSFHGRISIIHPVWTCPIWHISYLFGFKKIQSFEMYPLNFDLYFSASSKIAARGLNERIAPSNGHCRINLPEVKNFQKVIRDAQGSLCRLSHRGWKRPRPLLDQHMDRFLMASNFVCNLM